jgi:hypothetical protein
VLSESHESCLVQGVKPSPSTRIIMRSWHDYALISSIPNDECTKFSFRKSFKNVSMVTFLELFLL